MQYTLKRTRNNRGIRVRVLVGGEVLVSAGKCVSDTEIERFLYEHRRWVASHIASMTDKARYLERYSRGDVILLHGIERPVRYVEGRGASTFDGECVTIYTTGDRHNALDRWYRGYARAYLTRMYHEIAQDVCPMQVKRVKSYYGICYRSQQDCHIYLNEALVHADDDCIRYVIHHEMVHLDVPNHGSEFYARLSRLEPQHKEIEHRLKSIVRM